MDWLVRGSQTDSENDQLCLNLVPSIISKNMITLREADSKSREMLLQVIKT